MFSLALVLGSAGAMLIVVGAVGGGFTFSGSVIPKLGRVARVVSFAAGAVLLVAGLGVLGLDPSLQGSSQASAATPAPVPAAPAAGSTSSGELDPLDQQVVAALQQRPSFANASAGDLIAITHAQCGALQRGATGSDVVSIATNNGVSYDDAVYALRVSIAAYCGDYAAQASQ